MTCCLDGERPDFYCRDLVQRAGKAHTCCECGAVIEKGHSYYRTTAKWDGSIDRFKQCESCGDLFDSLSQIWCIYLGFLREGYAEYIQETSREVYVEETDEYVGPCNHLFPTGDYAGVSY